RFVAAGVGAYPSGQRFGAAHGVPVDGRDHVTGLDPGTFGRRVRDHFVDFGTDATRAVHLGHAVLQRHPEEGVFGGAVLDQLVGDIGGQVHGNGEAEADAPAGLTGGGDRGG